MEPYDPEHDDMPSEDTVEHVPLEPDETSPEEAPQGGDIAAQEPDAESSAEQPAVDEPAVDEPAVDEPAVEQPAVEQPAAEEPAVEEPAADEPAVEQPAAAEPLPLAKLRPVPWWPFLLHALSWVALSGVTAWLLTMDKGLAPVESPDYVWIVIVGLMLTVVGPIVGLTVWAVVRTRVAAQDRGGLLTTSLIRSAAVTLIGVLAWWITLNAVDAWRLGRL